MRQIHHSLRDVVVTVFAYLQLSHLPVLDHTLEDYPLQSLHLSIDSLQLLLVPLQRLLGKSSIHKTIALFQLLLEIVSKDSLHLSISFGQVSKVNSLKNVHMSSFET